MTRRHMVGLHTDIIIEFPEGMELDSSNPKVQNFLRETFIDYLESAEHIELYFDIEEEEADE